MVSSFLSYSAFFFNFRDHMIIAIENPFLEKGPLLVYVSI